MESRGRPVAIPVSGEHLEGFSETAEMIGHLHPELLDVLHGTIGFQQALDSGWQ
jgi:hypothetical protein